jgi:hypothetical protein
MDQKNHITFLSMDENPPTFSVRMMYAKKKKEKEEVMHGEDEGRRANQKLENL